VLAGHTRTPAQILGELLASHPEAASLQAEATHCQALARGSVVRTGRAFAAAQAARLAYEELRHHLDPRRHRTVGFGAGSMILALLGAGLTLLNVIELSGQPGGTSLVLLGLVATIVWLTGAWVAARASQEHRWQVGIAGVVLDLLLAAVHGSSHRNVLFGVLVSAFILALAVGGAALMSKMEPASLFWARRRWHDAQAACAAAVRTENDDVERATVAAEAWLGLVRSRASALSDDGQLVHEALALASELLW
jgi:hypothetical protein